MGFRALIYYIVTTILAAIVGIVMVLMIHPGDSSLKTTIIVSKIDYVKVSTVDAVLDIIRYVKRVKSHGEHHRRIA